MPLPLSAFIQGFHEIRLAHLDSVDALGEMLLLLLVLLGGQLGLGWR